MLSMILMMISYPYMELFLRFSQPSKLFCPRGERATCNHSPQPFHLLVRPNLDDGLKYCPPSEGLSTAFMMRWDFSCSCNEALGYAKYSAIAIHSWLFNFAIPLDSLSSSTSTALASLTWSGSLNFVLSSARRDLAHSVFVGTVTSPLGDCFFSFSESELSNSDLSPARTFDFSEDFAPADCSTSSFLVCGVVFLGGVTHWSNDSASWSSKSKTLHNLFRSSSCRLHDLVDSRNDQNTSFCRRSLYVNTISAVAMCFT